MLKSSSGLKLELFHSLDYHSTGIPLLVSSALLRGRDMGQVDLAKLIKVKGEWTIEIAEVKSSDIGSISFLRHQRSRLFSSAKFLSGIFGHRSKFLLLTGKNSV